MHEEINICVKCLSVDSFINIFYDKPMFNFINLLMRNVAYTRLLHLLQKLLFSKTKPKY